VGRFIDERVRKNIGKRANGGIRPSKFSKSQNTKCLAIRDGDAQRCTLSNELCHLPSLESSTANANDSQSVRITLSSSARVSQGVFLFDTLGTIRRSESKAAQNANSFVSKLNSSSEKFNAVRFGSHLQLIKIKLDRYVL
jgi:hypothetical protein